MATLALDPLRLSVVFSGKTSTGSPDAAVDPLVNAKSTEEDTLQEGDGEPGPAVFIRGSDRSRSVVASAVFASWLLEQLRHDALRLFTDFPRWKDPDLYWPISAMSMYAYPQASASFGWTALLGIFVLGSVSNAAIRR